MTDGTLCTIFNAMPAAPGTPVAIRLQVVSRTTAWGVADGDACDRPLLLYRRELREGICNGPSCSGDGAACETCTTAVGRGLRHRVCEAHCASPTERCDGTRPCCSGVSCLSGTVVGLPGGRRDLRRRGPVLLHRDGLPGGSMRRRRALDRLACEQSAVALEFSAVASDGAPFFGSSSLDGRRAGARRRHRTNLPEALTKLLSAARALDSSPAGYTDPNARNFIRFNTACA